MKSSSKKAHDCGQPLIGCWAPISLSISRTRYPCPAEQTTGVGTPCMGTYNVPTLPISLESVVSLSTQSAGQEQRGLRERDWDKPANALTRQILVPNREIK